jgi:hypothetical protein
MFSALWRGRQTFIAVQPLGNDIVVKLFRPNQPCVSLSSNRLLVARHVAGNQLCIKLICMSSPFTAAASPWITKS